MPRTRKDEFRKPPRTARVEKSTEAGSECNTSRATVAPQSKLRRQSGSGTDHIPAKLLRAGGQDIAYTRYLQSNVSPSEKPASEEPPESFFTRRR
ncbi:unnamed protein product [Strongylus vulgaris]|uniref:Uncharacterized protein n=1 Tax=Strongylus vulgaris TaxID=40348 RepID=A0A3P7L1T3_STRVU|nr:unnamed protein product [Strongylus vulgaris]